MEDKNMTTDQFLKLLEFVNKETADQRRLIRIEILEEGKSEFLKWIRISCGIIIAVIAPFGIGGCIKFDELKKGLELENNKLQMQAKAAEADLREADRLLADARNRINELSEKFLAKAQEDLSERIKDAGQEAIQEKTKEFNAYKQALLDAVVEVKSQEQQARYKLRGLEGKIDGLTKAREEAEQNLTDAQDKAENLLKFIQNSKEFEILDDLRTLADPKNKRKADAIKSFADQVSELRKSNIKFLSELNKFSYTNAVLSGLLTYDFGLDSNNRELLTVSKMNDFKKSEFKRGEKVLYSIRLRSITRPSREENWLLLTSQKRLFVLKATPRQVTKLRKYPQALDNVDLDEIEVLPRSDDEYVLDLGIEGVNNVYCSPKIRGNNKKLLFANIIKQMIVSTQNHGESLISTR